MADRFINRNGVRKVIDGDDPVVVERARSKGWAFEDESAPTEVVTSPQELEPATEATSASIRVQRGDVQKDIAPDVLDYARSKGWAEVQTERVDRTEPTDGERTQATAQGFLKGAALGAGSVQDYVGAAGDQVASWFDGVPRTFSESLDMMRANREATAAKAPGNALGGEIAGTVASALAPGGAANLAARAGASVVTRVAPQIATRVGAGLLGRALAATTGLAVEGAAYDAAEAVTGELDKAIASGDWMGAAERLPAEMIEQAAKGALFNVAGGAVIHGVTSAVKLGLKSFRKGAQEAVEAADDELTKAVETKAAEDSAAADLRTVERQEIEATRTKLDAAEDAATLEAKATDELTRNMELAQPKPEKQFADDMARYVDAYEGYKSFREHADQNVHRLKAALDVLEENAEYADTHLALAQKNRVIREAENGYGQAISDPEVGAMFDRFSTSLKRESEVALDDFTAKKLTGLAAMADRAHEMVGKRLSAGDVGDAHVLLANMNRELGKLAASGKRGPARDLARSQYDELKTLLERQDLFGDAAKIQKPFNAVWAPEITAETADALSGMWGKTGRASTVDGFIKSERVNASWLESHLKNIAEGASDKDEALRQYIATKATSQSVRADLLGSAEGLERALKSREAMATALQILDENAAKKQGARVWSGLNEDLTARKLINDTAGQAVRGAAIGTAATAVGGTVGTAVLGPGLGTVVGAGIGGGLTYLASKFTKSSLERALDKAATQATKNEIARKAVADKLALNIRKAEKAQARAATKAAGRNTWTGKVERAVDAAQTPAGRAAVRKKLEQLDSEREADITGPLSALTPVLGPDLVNAYAQQHTARNSFLREKLGPAPAPTPFGIPKRVLSDEEIDRMGRYLSAVDDPTAAVERLGDGSYTAEDKETLRALYPGRLNDFRAQVMESISQRKTKLDYEAQIAMAEALDLPQAVPQLSGKSIAFWSGIAQVSASEPRPAVRGTKADLPGSEAQTQSDRIG